MERPVQIAALAPSPASLDLFLPVEEWIAVVTGLEPQELADLAAAELDWLLRLLGDPRVTSLDGSTFGAAVDLAGAQVAAQQLLLQIERLAESEIEDGAWQFPGGGESPDSPSSEAAIDLLTALENDAFSDLVAGFLEDAIEARLEQDARQSDSPQGEAIAGSGASVYQEIGLQPFGSSESRVLSGLQPHAGGESLAGPETISGVPALAGAASLSAGTESSANAAPRALGDTGSTDEETALIVAAPGLLANDSDPENVPLRIVGFDAASVLGAAVTVNADGSYSYDPSGSAALNALAVGENANDTFTYTISDGNGGSDTATVTIDVAGVNDAPTASADAAATAVDSASIITVLANDSDPDTSDSLSVTAVTQGTSGGVTINGGITVTYTPNAGFAGLDSFTYTIADGNGGGDTASVYVTVGNVLQGTAGTDILTGTAGVDALYGYVGNDNLTGGAGADVFYFDLTANEGSDDLLDFSTLEGDLLSFTDVTDVDAPGGIDIDDVAASFIDGGGAGLVDTLVLESGTTLNITDVDGTLTNLLDLAANSLINGA